MADPNAQLQRLVDGLANSGTGYLDRIDCMNGEMAKKKDTNAPGYFANAPDVTVGQACRGLLELTADNTANGRAGGGDLPAPYRYMVTGLVFDDGANSASQRAAQGLVNGYVNGSRNPDNANTRGVLVRLDGQGRTYPLTPGAALDASFTQVVLEVQARNRTAPNRISSWNEEQVNSAVEGCVRARSTLRQCSAVGQEVAAIYLQRRGGLATR